VDTPGSAGVLVSPADTPMKAKSLAVRATLFMVVVFGLTAAMTSGVSGWEQAHAVRTAAVSRGKALSATLADSTAPLLREGEVAALERTLTQLRLDADLDYVLVTDGATGILAHSFGANRVPPELLAIAAQPPSAEVRELKVAGRGVLHFAAPIREGGRQQVHVGLALAPLRREFWRIFVQEQEVVLVLVLGSVLAAIWFVRRITRPLEQLTDYAGALVRRNFADGEGKREGARAGRAAALSPRLLGQGDEVGRLARAFASMEAELQSSIANLELATAARERMESELRIAHEIQMNILPQSFPPFPDRAELDLHAYLNPARQVGGDFFDFFLADSNRLFLAIGDVSGKGVPASIFMAVTTTLVRAAVWRVSTPAEVLGMVNTELARDNPSAMFVTLFLGLLDLRSGVLEYANGGHNLPLLRDSGGRVRVVEGRSGPLLGYAVEQSYHPHRLTLERGDSLLLFTDGLTEALAPGGEFFGEERVRSAFAALESGDVQSQTAHLVAAVQRFAAGEPQADDLTLLLLRFRGAPCID
jgi:serine phosphatase RsbU (regulator of sigma subunit)